MRKQSVIISILALLLFVCVVAGCSSEQPQEQTQPTQQSEQKLRINVPSETITAELGTYDLPKYEVVNEDNLILQQYAVSAVKVVGPDGKEVTVAFNKIDVSVPGVYEVTYSAKGVAESLAA